MVCFAAAFWQRDSHSRKENCHEGDGNANENANQQFHGFGKVCLNIQNVVGLFIATGFLLIGWVADQF